jgi:23S rRNA pseudouridine1911/1915/1917 synthase
LTQASGEGPKTLSLIFEDEHFLAIDKPSGLLSHANPGKEEDSVVSRLLEMGLSLVGGEDPLRTGLVHRLDRDTSGILLCSKSEEAYRGLQDQFRNREVSKTYHFLASGKIRRMEFTRRDRLGRHPVRRNTRMVSPEGRDAETSFRLMELLGDRFALWEAKPKTGRTHQIRVHAKAAGFSILGDPHYADRNSLQGSDMDKPGRTLLHCCKLSFSHPIEKNVMEVNSEYPGDFSETLSYLREKFSPGS